MRLSRAEANLKWRQRRLSQQMLYRQDADLLFRVAARMRDVGLTEVLRVSAFVGAVVILSPVAPAVAQEKPAGTSTAGKPPKSDDVGLPLPKPVPQVVNNPDGSTTTTSRSGRGTRAITVDKDGALVSTVIK